MEAPAMGQIQWGLDCAVPAERGTPLITLSITSPTLFIHHTIPCLVTFVWLLDPEVWRVAVSIERHEFFPFFV